MSEFGDRNKITIPVTTQKDRPRGSTVDIRSLAARWAGTAKREQELSRAQTIEVQLHFPFRVVAATSRIFRKMDGTSVVEQHLLRSFHPQPVDPYRMREEFLALKRNDAELQSFLNKYGLWENEPFEVDAFWDMQEFLGKVLLLNPGRRGKLLSRSAFGKLPGPLHKGLIIDFEYNEGGIQFVVNAASCLGAVIASLQIDLVNRTKYRKCARKNCPVVFSISTGDKRKDTRKYHDGKCQHRDVVRRSRIP